MQIKTTFKKNKIIFIYQIFKKINKFNKKMIEKNFYKTIHFNLEIKIDLKIINKQIKVY